MSALELREVCVPGRLAPVTLALGPGQMAGLVGPNGSGKSTLLQAACGLLPHTGEVRWLGQPLARLPVNERGRMTAWVPQEAHFEFGFSVRAVVAQGRYAHGDDGRGVEEALARFDLTSLADRPVNHLSGGERHRVLLARARAPGGAMHQWGAPRAARAQPIGVRLHDSRARCRRNPPRKCAIIGAQRVEIYAEPTRGGGDGGRVVHCNLPGWE